MSCGKPVADMGWLHVIKPGMLTTVQDRGRWGLQSRGVPVAGPMDPCSHRLANALAGNDADQATLEVTLVGPELEFDDERLVAVAGAEFELTVDGRPAPMCAAGGYLSSDQDTIEVEFGLLTAILGMKVRRLVLLVVDPDHRRVV